MNILLLAVALAAPSVLRSWGTAEGLPHVAVQAIAQGADARRAAHSTNLPPGTYRFRIEAAFRRTWWFAVLIAGLILGALWLVDRQRVHRIELRHAAALAERRRIARELHDTLGQGLSGVALQIETALATIEGETRAQRHLGRAKELVTMTMNDARRALADLRADALDGRDLVSALRLLAASSAVATDVEVRGRTRRLGIHVENHLYRIAQEALTNSFRHANASRVTIAIAFQNERVVLRINDDGVGLASEVIEEHQQGLRGMRERAAQIGARIAIRGDQGVEIVVDLPVV
ncbi:MAG TPA: sensor histidine kinase [Thermoanaerobaculia bacterium]